MSRVDPLNSRQPGIGNTPRGLSQMVREALDRLLQSTGALVFIVLALPAFVALGIVVWLADGRPVIYAGERLGRFKRVFTMFKFRSLVQDAEARVGGDIMNKRMADNLQLEHRYGRFLRDTRLDELPQLFNVLRGDMDFVGPRPIRRKVYEKHGQQVKDFDVRFLVRPGLLGPSQVFTAHAAPPRLRSLIDNRFVRRKQSAWADVGFVLFVFTVLGRNLLLQVMRYGLQFYCTSRATGKPHERRRSNRIQQEGVNAQICSRLAPDFRTFISHDEESWEGPYRVIDMSNEAMLIESEIPVVSDSLDMRLEKNVARRGHAPKRRVCYVRGHLKFRKELPDSNEKYYYVVDYESISPLNHYKLHQYFLEESVA